MTEALISYIINWHQKRTQPMFYGIIKPTEKHYNPTNSIALLNKEWFLNRVRLLKDVQYLSLMNLIEPTAVYILGHHWPEIYIAGYQLLRRDRYGKASGGIAIYVEDDLNCVRFIKYDVLILKLSGLKYVHSLSDCLLVVCTDLLTVLISLTNFAVLWEKVAHKEKCCDSWWLKRWSALSQL